MHNTKKLTSATYDSAVFKWFGLTLDCTASTTSRDFVPDGSSLFYKKIYKFLNQSSMLRQTKIKIRLATVKYV